MTTPLLCVPPSEAERKSTCVGSVSVTVAFVAAICDVFVTVSVYVRISPCWAVVLPSDFVMTKEGFWHCTVVTTVWLVLFREFGSFTEVTVAWFSIVSPQYGGIGTGHEPPPQGRKGSNGTLNATVATRESPLASVPTVHSTVVPLCVQMASEFVALKVSP